MNETSTLLDALRDLHTWPTAGSGETSSVWLLVLLLGVAASVAIAVYRRRRRPQWRREADAAVARLRASTSSRDARDTLGAVAALVRRVVLVADRRERVASLTGGAWLSRLDALVGEPFFTAGPGRLIDDAPWRIGIAVRDDELEALFEGVERLVRCVARRERRGRLRRSVDRLRALGRSRAGA